MNNIDHTLNARRLAKAASLVNGKTIEDAQFLRAIAEARVLIQLSRNEKR